MVMDVSHSVCYNVVKVFSLNRIISLAERQAFAHCCELLQAITSASTTVICIFGVAIYMATWQ